VNVADFESAHFATQLVERLGWAVEDADVMEQTRDHQPAEGAAPAEQRYEEQGEPADQDSERLRQDPIEFHASV
jgi:hypothetical protein